MSNKYYCLYLVKKIDKKNQVAMDTFKFIQNRLRASVFDPEPRPLYVEPFSAIIKCRDAFYADSIKNMPIIVAASEEGFFDVRTGDKIEIYEPIRLHSEVTPELKDACISSLNQDHLSRYNYEESVKKYIKIIEEYKKYLEETLGLNPEDFKIKSFEEQIENVRKRTA